MTSTPERAFVLGLDGVPWKFVDRWAEEGELPNFARVLREGTAGPLKSTTPPTTPLAWPAIATGTWPDKHGIYGFQRLSESYRKRMYTSEDVRQPELWDILSPVQVGNVPMTYPASEVDGRMVTGMMTPALDERSVHPPSLGSELTERLPSYRIGLDWSEYRDRTSEFRDDLADLVAARRELMRWFMEAEDWRLFFFVYVAPDRLQHLIWEESTLLEHYRLLDDILGEVMAYVAERDAVLFVVSDHGFGPLSKFVHVNHILEEAGYVSRVSSEGARGVLSRMGISRDNVSSILRRLRVSDEQLLEYLPRTFVDRAAESIPGTHELYDVDHARTTAFLAGLGMLYVNDTHRFDQGIVDPETIPEVKTALVQLLESVTDPESGEPVLNVFDGQDIYSSDPFAPDLVVKGREGYEIATSLAEEPFSSAAGRMAAGHRDEGILLAWGGPIDRGAPISGATVVDVAPTLLHCLGEPVGESMDGRVLRSLFSADSEPARRQVERRNYEGRERTREVGEAHPDTDDTEVADRLRGLGYLE